MCKITFYRSSQYIMLSKTRNLVLVQLLFLCTYFLNISGHYKEILFILIIEIFYLSVFLKNIFSLINSNKHFQSEDISFFRSKMCSHIYFSSTLSPFRCILDFLE